MQRQLVFCRVAPGRRAQRQRRRREYAESGHATLVNILTGVLTIGKPAAAAVLWQLLDSHINNHINSGGVCSALPLYKSNVGHPARRPQSMSLNGVGTDLGGIKRCTLSADFCLLRWLQGFGT